MQTNLLIILIILFVVIAYFRRKIRRKVRKQRRDVLDRIREQQDSDPDDNT